MLLSNDRLVAHKAALMSIIDDINSELTEVLPSDAPEGLHKMLERRKGYFLEYKDMVQGVINYLDLLVL